MQMSVPSKLIYRFKAIPIKIANFYEVRKFDMKASVEE